MGPKRTSLSRKTSNASRKRQKRENDTATSQTEQMTGACALPEEPMDITTDDTEEPAGGSSDFKSRSKGDESSQSTPKCSSSKELTPDQDDSIYSGSPAHSSLKQRRKCEQLKAHRESQAKYKDSMTPQQQQEQREKDKERHRQARRKMTTQQLEEQREKDRVGHREAKEKMTPQQQEKQRKKDREGHRQARERMTPQQQEEQREKDRAGHREAREKMTPQQQEEQREKNKKRQSQAREKMTPQQQEEQREKNRERQNQAREKMTPQQQEEQRKKDRAGHREAREKMTPQQQEEQREKNRERQNQAREKMTPQQQEEQRKKDRAGHREAREKMTPQQQEEQREKNRERQSQAREKMTPQQQEEQREKNREKQSQAREKMTPQQQEKQREKDREGRRESRERLTQEQKKKQQEQDLERHKQSRILTKCKTANIGRQHSIDNSEKINVTDHSCGAMDKLCQHCGAHMFATEQVSGSQTNPQFGGLCCLSGKIKLPHPPEPPHELRELYTDNTEESKRFRSCIRIFNNAMCMASMKANDTTIRTGISNYRIQGRVYRMMGPPRNAEGSTPSFLQTYFYQAEEQLTHRLDSIPGESNKHDKTILTTLFDMLKRTNTYLRSFLSIGEYLDRQPNTQEMKVIIHADKKPSEEHTRRFNLPTNSEVAVLLPNENCGERSVVCEYRSQGMGKQELVHFDENHRSYDPLCYPLLFPHGSDGFHLGIPQDKGDRNVTALQFYAYNMMQRHTFNPLFFSGKLFQQYVVDMWAKVESGRLKYLKFHQEDLRSEVYQGLADAIGSGDADRAGTKVVLPSSFTSGPRFMAKHYHDAMAIVRKFGKPTLFVTFTCSSKWPEIVSQLQPGQTASDRPDLTARVFKMKQQQLLKDIKNGVLGELQAHVCTIEFQKRGLPHCHYLFIMKEQQQTWQDIDRVISAEVPNPQHKELYDAVTSHMVHGPCGATNPKCPCMKDGECSKEFPKLFCHQTQIGDDAYPTYRRRSPEDGGHTTEVYVKDIGQTVQVDNRNIVPYNPWLLLKYKAHINVEYCASIKAVKYLYKYIYKGSDQATVTLEEAGADQEKDNEILRYEQCRYIGASEAAWRIFAFPTQDRSPAVIYLPVHLEEAQRVTFNPASPQDALDRAQKTHLTAYFAKNAEDPSAREILYFDFPEHFTWQDDRTWKRRVRTPTTPIMIGRVSAVHPNEGERFYLRLLLHNKAGAISFTDLRTVDGKVCATFKEACQRLHLLADDSEWIACLEEAKESCIAVQMRSLFTTILTFCEPADALGLFDRFKGPLADDYFHHRRKQGIPDNQIEGVSQNDLLCDLHDRLQEHGLSNSDFDLPNADFQQQKTMDVAAEELDPEAEAYFNENYPKLNSDQSLVFDNIKSKIDKGESGLIFIDAPGGTGKTFLLNLVLAYVRKNQEVAIATASSGIAATLLKLGRTAHSRFKFPIPPTETSTCKISPKDANGRLLKVAKVLVWDEAPMAHRFLLDALDRTLKDIMQSQEILGGKLLILAGDFRQILPVVRRARRAEIVQACLIKSPLWQQCTKLHLRINMRVLACKAKHQEHSQDLQEYADWLLKLGEGKVEACKEAKYFDAIQIPSQLCVSAEEDLMHHVYNEIDKPENIGNSKYLADRGILTTKNVHVDKINTSIMDQLPGPEVVVTSIDTVRDKDQGILYPPEFLNSLNISGLPPHQMVLKENAPIMLLRNIDPKRGHCNGTRYVLTKVTERLLEARMLAGEQAGTVLHIPRIVLSPSDTDMPFQLCRRQFPIRPAFCITINKSQGQSFKRCGLLLPSSVFTHGQLYVAASRVGDPRAFRVFADQKDFANLPKDHKYTRNVVYSEVLQ